MKFISQKKLKCNQIQFNFSHRIKGVKIGLQVTTYNREAADKRAWELVSQIYKDLKKAGKEPFVMPEGAERMAAAETLTHLSIL
jgi:hypothetical protein